MSRRGFLAILWIMVIAIVFAAGCANPHDPTEPDDPSDPLDQPADPNHDPNPDPPPTDPEPDPPQVLEQTMLINFDVSTDGISNGQYVGAGFSAEPEPGQLDSDAWSTAGFSDGDSEFGAESSGGDWARGISPGGVSTGGLYAFTVESENHALGFQPTASDFAPGSVALRIPTPSGSLTECSLSYRSWSRNDQNRSTIWSMSYSIDGAAWIEIPAMSLSTPAAADLDPVWAASDLTAVLPLVDVAVPDGGQFYLRWDSWDGDGDGSRDESAIDDISVTFSYQE